MQMLSLGKIVVPTAGTPVQISTVGGGTGPWPQAHKIIFRPASSNTGIVYVKVGGVIAAELQKPSAGMTDQFETPSIDGNQIQLNQFFVDAATNGDGVYVSYFTA